MVQVERFRLVKRSFRVLAILSATILGAASMWAAALSMCLSSLTGLSGALEAGNLHYAESRHQSVQLLLWGDLWNDMTAGLASVPDVPQQGVQFTSFESRFLSAQLLLRRELRNETTAGLASVPNVPQQGIQFIRFDLATLPPMAFTQFCLKYASDCKPQRLLFGATGSS